MRPLDPGRDWLAAGITGLARQREWDAVATVDAPGEPGEELEYVALPDGRLIAAEHGSEVQLERFADALRGAVEPPYRALAVRRPDVWAVGAVTIEVANLDPPVDGEELTLTWDGETPSLLVDGMPADPSRAGRLADLASARFDEPYAAHARRLDGDVWEVSILRL